MKGGGLLDSLYILLFIVAVVGAMVLGGWLVLKYYKPPAAPTPPPKPDHPPPEPSGWGPGPWGPDPWDPNYKPDVPGHHPKPGPEPPKPPPPDNFKPVLNLLSAKYDHVSRQIKIDYKVVTSGSIPPSKSFTIEYDVLIGGQKISDIPSEEEPLTSAEMSGLQQESLLSVVGAPSDVKASDLSVSAQIHFRENGTANVGVIGIPVTINVA